MARRATPVAWYDADETPNVAVTSGQKIARAQAWYRKAVIASVVLLPLSLVVTILAVLRPSAPRVQAQTATAPGEGQAQVALLGWLNETPSPLPRARVLYFAGATAVPVAHVARQSGDAAKVTWSAKDENFVLVSSGKMYQASVEVVFPPGNATGAVNGSPALLPLPGSVSNPAQSGPWPGVTAASGAPAAVTQAVQGWAQAYTSGSASTLRLAVGDTAPGDHYTPLSGVTSENTNAAWSAPLSKTTMVVNINMSLTWRHQQAPGQYQISVPEMSMDLLIERANTPAPVVVAWGAPGSGPSLTAYQNAR